MTSSFCCWMTRFLPLALVLGEEHVVLPDHGRVDSVTDLFQELVHGIRASLSGLRRPSSTGLWLSIPTFVGWSRGQLSGVIRAQVVARVSGSRERVDSRALAQEMIRDIELDDAPLSETSARGWVSSRRLRAQAAGAGSKPRSGQRRSARARHGGGRVGGGGAAAAEDDADEDEDASDEEDEGSGPADLFSARETTLECFLDPKALVAIIRRSGESGAAAQDELVVDGVAARSLPTAMRSLWGDEDLKAELVALVVNSAFLEVPDGTPGAVESGWVAKLTSGRMRREWCERFDADLSSYAERLLAQRPASTGAEDDGDIFLVTKGQTGAAERHPSRRTATTGSVGSPLGGVAQERTPQPAQGVNWDDVVRLVQAITQGLSHGGGQPRAASVLDGEGARTLRVLKRDLPPHLRGLLESLTSRAASGSGMAQAACQEAVRVLEGPERTVGDPEHAALGATARTAGECVSYVANTVGERVVAVGLQGALLGTSATDGRLAGEFLVQFVEHPLEEVAAKSERALRSRGEPPNALSSSGSMGTRRVEVLRGVLSLENVSGVLPLFLPPRFRLGERDYADAAELEEAGSASGARAIVWGGSRPTEYRHGVRNVAADRPRAAQYFVDAKTSHHCSVIQHAVHGYLEMLDAVKVPPVILRLLRGGLLRAAAHLDDSIDVIIGWKGKTAPARAVAHLSHAFVVLDEACVQFFTQFDHAGSAVAFDKTLRDRDDLEPTPLFKRLPALSGGTHSFPGTVRAGTATATSGASGAGAGAGKGAHGGGDRQ